MRKRVFSLFLILALVLGITAQAAETWVLRTEPSISFSGTTATCKVTVRGDKASDAISLTAKLWQGSTCLKDWQASGVGSVILSKPATVVKGEAYRLTADATIDGVKQPTKAYSAICP